jgi:hypothetical protein
VSEPYRDLKNSLCEVSKRVRRIDRILTTPGTSAPETYLSAIQAIRALQDAWSLHLKIERDLFPRIFCRNPRSAEFLKRIFEGDQAIEAKLEAILSAPWPRLPQAGLQPLRTGISKILTELVARIERENALILPAIPAPDQRGQSTAGLEIETSGLVTI